jgi:hypothetical protein
MSFLVPPHAIFGNVTNYAAAREHLNPVQIA